jgi:hypothetical protein
MPKFMFQNKDGDYRPLRMHRLIMGQPPNGREVDHINGDGLNNRRSNLRWATRQQNCQNGRPRSNARSKLKGAQWCSSQSKWGAEIKHNGRVKQLGYFQTEQEAAAAYDAAASKAFGEFARLNAVHGAVT